MPKVTDEYRAAKRDEILDAAQRAFRRRGFHATSMAEIIAESEMSAGAIYGYFPGKSDLVLAVATRVVAGRIVDIDELSRMQPMQPPSTVVKSALAGMIGALGHPSVVLQVWGEMVTDPSLLAVCADIFAQLRAAIVSYISLWQQTEHGLPEDEANRVANDQAPLFMSAIQGYVVQDSLHAEFDGARYLEQTLEYLPR